jgi:hypothetical protein
VRFGHLEVSVRPDHVRAGWKGRYGVSALRFSVAMTGRRAVAAVTQRQRARQAIGGHHEPRARLRASGFKPCRDEMRCPRFLSARSRQARVSHARMLEGRNVL